MGRSRPRRLRDDVAVRIRLAACLLGSVLAGCAGTRREAPAPSALPPRAEQTVPQPATDAWKSTKSIRVGLAVAAGRLLVAGSESWTLRTLHGKEFASKRAGEALRIARDGGGKMGVYREGEPAPFWTGAAGDTIVLVPSGRGYAGWGGKWYRGTFRIYASQPDGLTLVNEVDMEGYLRSVLPNEIGSPPESDFEAVKAQAVAARSYTLSYLGRRAALGFDLYASVEDQVYGGIDRENAQSERALDATAGEVLLSEGAPVRALYSSACGGRTANVEDVWPWAWTPYLRSVRDADGENETPYCSISANYRWREEWNVGAFMTMLREYGPIEGGALAALAGDLMDVRVKSRSRCGRVQDLAITTTEGEWVIHGDRTRWGLRRPGQSGILRSSYFKIGMIRDVQGTPVRVVASGGGNGHGIGLCQWGAMGMSRAGKNYRAILRHYYKHTTVERPKVRGD